MSKEKVVVVTGTSTGIGLSTALYFAERGHKVYATMRDPGRAGALRDAARRLGTPPTIMPMDVTDDGSVREAIAAVLAEAGRIDVLINNAGVAPFKPLEMADEALCREAFETNVLGPLRTIRAALPGMRARKAGTIVNMSSIGGRFAPMCAGLYVASKHALEAASEALAQEVRPFGVRVIIIEPGFFGTPILDKATSAIAKDPDAPYADAERRVSLWFSSSKRTAGDPTQVAVAIDQALRDPSPRLRYLVGPDAPVYVGGRARMSDEEWVDLGRSMTDETFFREFARHFPAG